LKKLITLSFFYLSLLSIAVVMHSCCRNPGTATIIGAEDIHFIQDVQLPASNVTTDTLVEAPFSMYVEAEVLYTATQRDYGLMSSAYGLSCEPDFVNTLQESSLILVCDQDFMFDGELIEAGSDRLGLLPGIRTSIDPQSIFVFMEISFMNLVTFENGPTTFRIKVKTTDDLELESVGTVVVDF